MMVIIVIGYKSLIALTPFLKRRGVLCSPSLSLKLQNLRVKSVASTLINHLLLSQMKEHSILYQERNRKIYRLKKCHCIRKLKYEHISRAERLNVRNVIYKISYNWYKQIWKFVIDMTIPVMMQLWW